MEKKSTKTNFLQRSLKNGNKNQSQLTPNLQNNKINICQTKGYITESTKKNKKMDNKHRKEKAISSNSESTK